MNAAAKLAYTLGGKIVRSESEAQAVRRHAVANRLYWLIPQCDSVITSFRHAAAAAAAACEEFVVGGVVLTRDEYMALIN